MPACLLACLSSCLVSKVVIEVFIQCESVESASSSIFYFASGLVRHARDSDRRAPPSRAQYS